MKYDDYKDEIITIRFDKEMLKQFTGYDTENPDLYFKVHKRAKKPPFEAIWKKSRNGLIPSINTFLNVTDRRIQNTWEQHLSEYCEFCMQKQGIKHNYIKECIILAIQFKPTKSKSDVNNIYTKPFIDATVKRELLLEDNYTVVRLHMEYAVVDKNDPRSEIRIYPIYEEDGYTYDFVLDYIANELKELNSEYKIA